jgi:hypothetical protein
MLLGFVLVLVSSVPMDKPPAPGVKRTQGADSGRDTGAGLCEHKLRVPPPQLGSMPGPAPSRPPESLELVPTGKLSEPGFRQLRSKRSHTTCTLLIAPLSPSFDSGGILVNPSTLPHDSIVRNDLSACTK